jgi:hypothetical protein
MQAPCVHFKHDDLACPGLALRMGTGRLIYIEVLQPTTTSVALCRGNGRMYGESLFTLARASGRAFRPGLLVPVAE